MELIELLSALPSSDGGLILLDVEDEDDAMEGSSAENLSEEMLSSFELVRQVLADELPEL